MTSFRTSPDRAVLNCRDAGNFRRVRKFGAFSSRATMSRARLGRKLRKFSAAAMLAAFVTPATSVAGPILAPPATWIDDIERAAIALKHGVGFDPAKLLASVATRYGRY